MRQGWLRWSNSAARPALKPVYPNHVLNVLLAFLVSSGAAVLSDLLDKTVRDPEQVARTLHAEVIGSLPLMKDQHAGSLAELKSSSADGSVGDRVTLKCGVQLWDGVTLEDDVFVGPNATFVNDPFPRCGRLRAEVTRTWFSAGRRLLLTALCSPVLRWARGRW